MTDFEKKADQYYQTVLAKRRAYYKINAKKSNDQCKEYHKKMMLDPDRHKKYLADRRVIYQNKKQKKMDAIQNIVDTELGDIVKNIQIEYEKEKEK